MTIKNQKKIFSCSSRIINQLLTNFNCFVKLIFCAISVCSSLFSKIYKNKNKVFYPIQTT